MRAGGAKRVEPAILGVRRRFGPVRELSVRVGWVLLPIVCSHSHSSAATAAEEEVGALNNAGLRTHTPDITLNPPPPIK